MELELFVMRVAVGLGAGYMAEYVMRDGGYGLIGDLALGLVGSILGSVIFQAVGVSPSAGLVVLAAVALLGAAIVIGGQRMLWHAHA
jgi:uncharacterized membrane protein YeaQ/YmgE (transglycosylase-associated protein family)